MTRFPVRSWTRLVALLVLGTFLLSAVLQLSLPPAQADKPRADTGADRDDSEWDDDDEGDDEDEDEKDDRRKPGKADWVVLDKFRDQPGTFLKPHRPEIDEIGGGWLPRGDWQIVSKGAVQNRVGIDVANLATLDPTITGIDLSAKLSHEDADTSIGLVFRYADANNHFRVVHDGKKLLLEKVVAGRVQTLDQKGFKWGSGEEKRLVVRLVGSQIQALVDGKKVLDKSDNALLTHRRVGMYHLNGLESRVTEFKVAGLAPPPGSEPPAPPPPPVITDSFSDADGTALAGHLPDTVVSAGWTEVTGPWEVHGGAARLRAATGGDQLAAVPTGLDEADISADITWNGSGLVGLSWAVEGPGRYSIVFWDGAGALVAGTIDGGFAELGRAPFSWEPGTKKRLRVRVNRANPGELPARYNARIYVDDAVVRILALNSGMGSSKTAGLFARGSAGNGASTFDSFQAGPPNPLLQPDPVLPVVPPPPPPPATVPAGAWVYDSFNLYNATQIQWRLPDLAQAGNGWRIDSGLWDTALFKARQKSGGEGDFFAFIDSGRDQYDLRAKVKWSGGRIGVVFGAHETDGRNQFLFWKHSDDTVVLGKLVGGVFFTLGRSDVKWKVGQTRQLRVTVEGTRLQAFVGNKQVFSLSDQELPGATHAGMFQRGDSMDRWEDFTVALAPGAPAPTPTPVPTPIPPVVADSFDGHVVAGNPSLEVSLIGRPPDTGPSGATWAASGWGASDWRSVQNGAGRVAIQRAPGDLEFRLHVETGITSQDIQAKIVPNGGISGLVGRFANESNFVFVWVTPGGSVTLARLEGGAFYPMGSAGVTWPSGAARNLRLVINGSGTRVYVDATQVISSPFTGMASNTRAGLFARATTATSWDDFIVRPAGP